MSIRKNNLPLNALFANQRESLLMKGQLTSMSHTNYWEDLSRWFSFALHRLTFIPVCCMQAVENEVTAKHSHFNILHIPPRHNKGGGETVVLETPINTLNIPEKKALIDHPHICRGCGHDIISRAHSSLVHEHTKLDHEVFHNWLSNDLPRLDVYQALPHACGYEQNLAGFNDEHLQRVEKYWAEHQLVSPSCTASAKLATAAEWERTKQLALEAAQRDIR